MSRRACQVLLVVVPLAAPLPVLAQAARADGVAAPRLRIELGGGSALMDPRDAIVPWQVDSLGWMLRAPERKFDLSAQEKIVVQFWGVACPMPVFVPAPGTTAPMPNAAPGPPATVTMPTDRTGCFNPLFRPR
ncbi:MAG: hypothetical protein OER90_01355 [Gemmatimonadota bacterium]|nr:hypothetical protein [Gemmatimonadota bacterium]